MNEKYVIAREYECVMICQTRSDAEEMILSLAEESVYENWYYDNYDGYSEKYETPAEYIANNGKYKRNEKLSDLAWALCSYGYGYWITKASYVD